MRRHPPIRRVRRARRGFTLIEAITTMVVIGLIAGASTQVTFQAFKAMDDASTRADLHNTVAAAMERVMVELRTLNAADGSNPPTPDIAAVTANSISFNYDSNPRDLSLSGSTLVITGDAGTNCVLAYGVTAFVVQAYDKANVALPASPSAAQIDAIRRIQITITAARNGITETVRSKVFIRSMAVGTGSA